MNLDGLTVLRRLSRCNCHDFMTIATAHQKHHLSPLGTRDGIVVSKIVYSSPIEVNFDRFYTQLSSGGVIGSFMD
jgi:hypothetical protein